MRIVSAAQPHRVAELMFGVVISAPRAKATPIANNRQIRPRDARENGARKITDRTISGLVDWLVDPRHCGDVEGHRGGRVLQAEAHRGNRLKRPARARNARWRLRDV
jgi:hypothetical protein